jgi:hypothetical protein
VEGGEDKLEREKKGREMKEIRTGKYINCCTYTQEK